MLAKRFRTLTILLLLPLGGCVYLPPIAAVQTSHAIPARSDTRIASALAASCPPAKTHALLIESPDLALVSRLDLIDAADESIDLQYFIWQNDTTGILVIEKLLAAADRGVRVRALVDDVQLEGLVNRLNALEDHPNIEVRIFNPFSIRWRYELGILRLAEFAIDGNRLNHRMHNKLLMVDNQIGILGGRNIGNDYFGVSRKRNFIDLDILLSGAIVTELSEGFDTYWNSQWSYPVNQLLNLSVFPDQLEKLRKRIRQRLEENPAIDVLAAPSPPPNTLTRMQDSTEIESHFVMVDDPSVSWFNKPDEIVDDLVKMALQAQREVLVVTPYFIPPGELIGAAKTLVDRGVKVRIVTNSLETNDVVIAQSAYSHYRRRVVEAGIDLYELRSDAPIVGENNLAENISLHTKYIVVDDDIVFIGSLNLDPRSLYLNTELGVTLQSAAVAAALRNSFNALTRAENSWRIGATDSGITWQSGDQIYTRTPAKNFWQRLRYWFYRMLPVSRQL